MSSHPYPLLPPAPTLSRAAPRGINDVEADALVAMLPDAPTAPLGAGGGYREVTATAEARVQPRRAVVEL
jgi:hypothetical protein